jgi:N-terminal acetyltransferase B complex catalytic subunit
LIQDGTVLCLTIIIPDGVLCLIIMPLFLQLGYVVYRRVLRYYSGEEDGLGKNSHDRCTRYADSNSFCLLWYWCSCLYMLFSDMRKALSQDVEKKSIIPLKRPITPDELEYD